MALHALRLMCALIVALMGDRTAPATREYRPVDTGLDPRRPETWQSAIDSAEAERRALASDLIAVAADAGRERETRRQAIFLLGRARDRLAIEFLMANLSVEIEKAEVTGDEDMAQEHPCGYALTEWGDWGTAHRILESLGEPHSRQDLNQLGWALHRTLLPEFARALVEIELKQATDPRRRENLKAIKDYLHG